MPPVLLLKYPGLHGSHTSAKLLNPPGAFTSTPGVVLFWYPVGQSLQPLCPVASWYQYCPLHTLQNDCAAWSWYSPCPHGVQLSSPSLLLLREAFRDLDPGLQGSHSLAPMLPLKYPSLQGWDADKPSVGHWCPARQGMGSTPSGQNSPGLHALQAPSGTLYTWVRAPATTQYCPGWQPEHALQSLSVVAFSGSVVVQPLLQPVLTESEQ